MLVAIFEAFEPEFMQRALLGSLLAVVATSVVGIWVVLRGMAFLADALAHGVIPGIAVALLFGLNPVLGAFLAAFLMVSVIGATARISQVNEDTATGLLFVGMLALGVVIVSKSQGFAVELTSLLFGDVLGVSRSDLILQAVAAAVVVGLTVVMFRPFMALTFNPVKAETLGMRPQLAHQILLLSLAISIVASFQTVGTLLVFGLLVGPPATALLLAKKVPLMILVSIGSGFLAAFLGLLVSYHFGTAGGATIAAMAVGQFFVVLGGKVLLDKLSV